MRTRAEITPKVGVAHKILQSVVLQHPPTVNPGSAPVRALMSLSADEQNQQSRSVK